MQGGVRSLALLAILAALLVGKPAFASDCEPLQTGASQISFSAWAGPQLPVYTYRPRGSGAQSRILFVMHGVNRDGDRYRDEWIALAEKHDLIIVVPTFGRADFPGSASYNLGNLFSRSDLPNPRERWSFSAIEPLFDEIACRVGSAQSGYAMYGHSAGGQFVHRFVALADAPRLEAAVAANSGWYTMLGDEAFPYGWGAGAAGMVDRDRALARPLTVLLGTEDIDRDDPNLRRNEAADRQGLTRLARGHAFYLEARNMALDSGRSFGWKIAYAPGVGHENGRMAPFAVPFLLHRTTMSTDRGR